jgi:RNA polymerase sigma-70 factor, ECF subfamily
MSARINRSDPPPRLTGVTAMPKAAAGDGVDRADVLARARTGDPRALRELAERELPRVERLLGRILGPRADFEDLVQNVFLEMCRALASYRGESSFSTFVGGIAVRVARRALRRSAYERRRGAMPEDVRAEGASPEGASIAHERLRLLHAALDRVDPKKRIAFTLWALEGLSPAEIAPLTGANVHTVRSRIFHARRELMEDPLLRELLEDS